MNIHQEQCKWITMQLQVKRLLGLMLLIRILTRMISIRDLLAILMT